MRVLESKRQILESLGEMDRKQTEKVLEFMRTVLMSPDDRADYQNFKKTALQQINQALKEG